MISPPNHVPELLSFWNPGMPKETDLNIRATEEPPLQGRRGCISISTADDRR